MIRRYPDADDLWQAIADEEDRLVRRELLIQMSRILLELEEMDWSGNTVTAVDSTASLLEYQAIGKLAAAHIQQALPWLDPDYQGEALEQELQQSQQMLQGMVTRMNHVHQQKLALFNQQAELESQQQTLQELEHDLQMRQQTLVEAQQAILSQQQTIASLQETTTQLQGILDQNEHSAQKETATHLLEILNPLLQQAIRCYQQLPETWQLHLDENSTVAESLLAQEINDSNQHTLEKLTRLAQDIPHTLHEYDNALSDAIRPA